jgi:UDP-glucose 4-epimerase
MDRRGRCLVLGGCGFIGSNLVEKLLTQEYKVRVLDTPSASRANLAGLESKIEFVRGNFLNEAEVDEAVQGVELVFHLIGTTLPASSNNDPTFDVETNVVASIKLLRVCKHHGVKKLIFASSGGTVYGQAKTIPIREDHPTEPICSYGITKLAIEKYLQLFHRLHGLDYTILRIANPYGRYQRFAGEQGIVGVFLSRLNDKKPIKIWGDGSATRDYIYVEDVANAFVSAINQNSSHRIFNIGTGVGTTIRDLLAKMARVTGIRPQVEYVASRSMDVSVNVLDPGRALECLDWRPEIECEEGLRRTWDWVCGRTSNVAGV